jgi:hypothetical protein
MPPRTAGFGNRDRFELNGKIGLHRAAGLIVLRLGILPTYDVIGKLVIRYEHCYPFISNSTSMAAFDCFSVSGRAR